MIGNKKWLKIIIVCLCVISLVNIHNIKVFAEDREVLLIVEDTDITMGTIMNIKITVVNMSGAEIKGVYGLDDFEVVSTSQISNTSTVNGKTNRYATLQVALKPKQVGTFSLKALVEHKGKEYESDTIVINVKEQDPSLSQEESDVFVKTKISKDSLYAGESFVLTYELYAAKNITDYGFIDTPTFSGMMQKQVDNEQLHHSQVSIGNKQYIKYEILQTVLTPTQNKDIHIPAFHMAVLLDSGDIFTRGEQISVATEAVTIPVKDLPEEGRPKNFSGLVGRLTAKATYDSDSVTFGEAVTLQVQIQGDMQLATVNEIDILVDLAEVYQSEKEGIVNIKASGYTESKEIEAVIVPKTAGDIVIDPIRLNYFDTQTKQYEEIEIPGKKLVVIGTEENSTEIKNREEQKEEKRTPIVIASIEEKQEKEYFLIPKDSVKYSLYIIGILIVGIVTVILLKRQSKKEKESLDFKIRIHKAKTKEEKMEILHTYVMTTYGFSITAYCEEDVKRKIYDKMVADEIIAVYNAIRGM